MVTTDQGFRERPRVRVNSARPPSRRGLGIHRHGVSGHVLFLVESEQKQILFPPQRSELWNAVRMRRSGWYRRVSFRRLKGAAMKTARNKVFQQPARLQVFFSPTG